MTLLSISVSLALLQTPATTPQVTKGSIEGVVVQGRSGTPLAGARVMLTRAPAANAGGGTGQGVPVPLPTAPPNPPPAPPPGLTGGAFVIQSIAAPAAGVGAPGGASLPSATTDGQGKYLFKDVDPGNYRVTFAANGYVKQDYGQKSFSAPGIPIAVTAGKATKDIDISMTPAGNMSGHLRDSGGMPVAGVPIQLLRTTYNASGQKGFQTISSDRTDDRGEFRLYWLTPGRYYLNAGTAPGPTNRPLALGGGGTSPNQVPGESFAYTYYPGVSNLNQAVAIEITAGSEISGIDMIVSRPLRPAVSGPLTSPIGVSTPQVPTPNADGTFHIDAVNTGEYRLVAANLPPEYYLKDARFGQSDVLNQPMQFSSGDTATLDIVISSGAVQIDGSAFGEKSEPVPGITVVLIPDQHRDRTELYKNTITDAAGRYSFRGVAPGEYRLYAWDSMEPYSWFDSDVIRRDEDKGKPVRILEGSNRTIDVRIISGL